MKKKDAADKETDEMKKKNAADKETDEMKKDAADNGNRGNEEEKRGGQWKQTKLIRRTRKKR